MASPTEQPTSFGDDNQDDVSQAGADAAVTIGVLGAVGIVALIVYLCWNRISTDSGEDAETTSGKKTIQTEMPSDKAEGQD